MLGIRRREFIRLLGGAAAVWPIMARAQQPANAHRIAVVRPSGSVADMTEAGDNPSYRALFNELRRLGYVERQNLIVERYSGEGHQERYAELAREVVRTKPHLILAASTPLVLIFKAATDTIPIVGAMADPVAMGVVSNLARPGGNVTGVSVDAGLEIWAKRLQILQEVVPTARKVGIAQFALQLGPCSGKGFAGGSPGAGDCTVWPTARTTHPRNRISACVGNDVARALGWAHCQ